MPVICVGNLTLGGTGKTPMVEWIARHLRTRDLRLALVSRGYGASEETRNDEALELEQRLPDVPHVQSADRVAASRMAVEEFESQVIVLDDGYQHRRLARDLDIVLIDAAEPFGYGRVFPRGMLREPLAGLNRADVVILSRADMVDDARRAEIRHTVERHAPDAIWAEVRHSPRQLIASSGTTITLEQLRGARIAAFCGIGNPAGFRHTLEACGCQIVAMREFADHHAYNRDDIASLAQWAAASNVSMVVCTHKDLVKIGLDGLGGVALWALAVGVDFISGRDALEAAIDAISPPTPGPAGPGA